MGQGQERRMEKIRDRKRRVRAEREIDNKGTDEI